MRRDKSKGGSRSNQSSALQSGGYCRKDHQEIAELGRQGVRFATFPETVVPYYPYFSFVQRPFEISAEYVKLLEQAVIVPSPTTHAIGQACKEAAMVVSVGVNERDGGTLYNTQLLFEADGTMLQRRRKISPTYHERRSGDRVMVLGCEPSTAQSGASASWHAGSTTTHWPAMP